jgi:hypothetical protein
VARRQQGPRPAAARSAASAADPGSCVARASALTASRAGGRPREGDDPRVTPRDRGRRRRARATWLTTREAAADLGLTALHAADRVAVGAATDRGPPARTVRRRAAERSLAPPSLPSRPSRVPGAAGGGDGRVPIAPRGTRRATPHSCTRGPHRKAPVTSMIPRRPVAVPMMVACLRVAGCSPCWALACGWAPARRPMVVRPPRRRPAPAWPPRPRPPRPPQPCQAPLRVPAPRPALTSSRPSTPPSATPRRD